MDTTVKHTGWPARAESNVTRSGSVPLTGVVAMSTCMRTAPEASVRRVINWNGTEVFPTDPISATYEESESVNSNEFSAPL